MIQVFGQEEPTYDIEEIYGLDEVPSEMRYVETYQSQQEAIQAEAEAGGGFLDIFKSIIGITAPVFTSIMKAEQKPLTTILPLTSIGTPVKTAGLTSNTLLLVGLGLGGFLLLRGRGKRRGK